ncbi:MAG TPA: HAD family acid phosphatase [Woeseiaceae bacterium]|nr:HAD family acid phosphatase [Woeseiaceae bacterium]
MPSWQMKELVMLATTLAMCASCVATGGTDEDPEEAVHGGTKWVLTAAEFEALCLQAYRAAGDFLEAAIGDPDWSALPDQSNARALPPAIIFDIDETTLSNAEFQATYIPPFTNAKLDDWSSATVARPLPGAVDFARRAQAAGVELFFITNRPCEPKAGVDHPCPQENVTLQDLAEAGIATDADHVMLANERPEWDREKVVRRNLIAQSHRVIMLLGDDLGDFIACTRSSPRAPCTEGATIASRSKATNDYRDYWGAGWFILPNPMHGSWTTVK